MTEKQENKYLKSHLSYSKDKKYDTFMIMKLVQSFEDHLRQSFSEIYVIDERGDGHHIEVIAIDPLFETMSRLERSRHILNILGGFQKTIHALSIKAYTPEQWKEKKSNFQPTRYVHLH